jgi:CelD/BcsL family acetyltransferase involved in cellulose biosynthesis
MGDGVVGSDYLGAICRVADTQSVALAFAEFLAKVPCTELILDGFLTTDPLAQALASAMAHTRVEPRYRCPHIQLRGSFDEYLAGRPNGTQTQWQRRHRWLMQQPGYAIECYREPTAVVRGLETLMRLHHERWAREGGSDAFDSPTVEQFHREAARAFALNGWARVYVLSAADGARAALYGWRYADRFVFYQAGYDPQWRRRSVGTVLLGHIISDCFKDGVTEFDFLRGTEDYKFNWANGERQTVRVRTHDGSWRAGLVTQGRATYRWFRHAGARALPRATQKWAQKLRRKVRQ